MTTLECLAGNFCTEYPHESFSAHDIVSLFSHPTFVSVLSKSASAADLAIRLNGSSKSMGKDKVTAKQMDGLRAVLTEHPLCYIKLRSMNLTQQLLSAMPPGVRESINKMASQLLGSIIPAASPPQSPTQIEALPRPIGECLDTIEETVEETVEGAMLPTKEGLQPVHSQSALPSSLPEMISGLMAQSGIAPAKGGPKTPSMTTSQISLPDMLSGLMQTGVIQQMTEMMQEESDDQESMNGLMHLMNEKITLLCDRVERLETRSMRKKRV
jgi:hypothetical protein